MRGRQWHNELGPIESGRTWRTSTAIPDMICGAAWFPLRAGRWLVRALWRFFRFILLAWFLAIGLTLLTSVSSSGGAFEGSDVKLFVVLFTCVIVGGGICLSDWLKHE